MTLRARPAAKRPSRAGWNSDERRTALINIGFVAAIVVAILILVGYAGFNWYSSHFGPAATVNGQTITKDDLAREVNIEDFRITYAESRIRNELAAGHLSQTDAQNQLNYWDQVRSSVQTVALEGLIDVTLQGQLASQAGISVTDADVDAELQKEQQIPEERHAWVIEVAPNVDPATGQVGQAQKDAAKAKADQALAELKSGTAWDTVAKAMSTAASAPQGGDLGWIQQQNSSFDQKFVDAVFAAQPNTPTDVILGDDGTYRIGRASEVSQATTDATFLTQLSDAGVSLSDYRVAVKADVVHQKLSDKVVADLSQPSLQRHVLEIYLPDVSSTAQASSVKYRQIVFAPNHDEAGASKVAATDPAWTAAQNEANATYHQLLLDPSQFDFLARSKSDDPGSRDSGGKEPWADTTTQLPAAVSAELFQKGNRNGEILPPVKGDNGWYVIQYMRTYGDGDTAWLQDLKTRAEAGIDFSQLARDNSEAPEAKVGGDIGWVVKGQLGPDQEQAIFSTPVGQISDPISVTNDGTYLFKVLAEETRTPDAKQIDMFKSSGFSNWYNAKKNAADIQRLVDTTSTTG
jgi:parvulin-like peptidyl-prolyl isomerase